MRYSQQNLENQPFGLKNIASDDLTELG